MIRKILLLSFLSINAMAQDQNATRILNELSEKTASYSSIEAHFINIFESKEADLYEEQSGKLYIQGDAYKLVLENQEIISDGETNWIHLIDEEEVNITEVDESEEMLNPKKMLTIYEEGYKHKFIKEDNSFYHLELYPTKSGPFSKVKIQIDKKKMQLKAFTMIDKQGSEFSYELKNYLTNQNFGSDFFIFDTKKYPNVDIIDLR